jgi:hypothetical protein
MPCSNTPTLSSSSLIGGWHDCGRTPLSRRAARASEALTLQRQIRRAGVGSRRGRRAEELVAQSGALSLLTNLVMAWNAHQMQLTIDRWHTEGRDIDSQILHHTTPMGFERINFGGILVFPMERYRARLLPSRPAAPTAIGA